MWVSLRSILCYYQLFVVRFPADAKLLQNPMNIVGILRNLLSIYCALKATRFSWNNVSCDTIEVKSDIISFTFLFIAHRCKRLLILLNLILSLLRAEKGIKR